MTWPDEATVERVAEAIYCADPCYSGTWANQPPEIQGYYRPMARAALSVLPDPTADTVLLDEVHACWCYRPGTCAGCGRPEGEHHNNQRHLIRDVQAVVAEWDDRGATWCMKRIAALLAGADQ